MASGATPIQAMNIDAYIKFDGIDGESTDVDHKGEIEVLSWNWGLTAPAAPMASGAASGKPTARELHLTHMYDKASPLLAKAAAQGKRIKTAVLTAHSSGNGQKDFFKITLKDVFITSLSISAGGSAGEMTEELSLAFSEITLGYKPQLPTGALGPEVTMGWNLKTSIVT